MAIKYQLRNKHLETLIEDLKLHMSNYDKHYNPVLEGERFHDIDFTKLLKIEKFITSVMMNKRRMYEERLPSPLAKDFDRLEISLFQKQPLRAVLKGRSEVFGIYLKTLFEVFARDVDHLFDESSPYTGGYHRNAHGQIFRMSGHTVEEKNALNSAVDEFRARIKLDEFKDKLDKENTKVRRRYDTAKTHLDDLFQKHGELTFICLDLVFIKERRGGSLVLPLLEVPRSLTADELQVFSTKLFRNGKNHHSLKDRAGFFQKWEYSLDKGRYSRCIFVYPTKLVADNDTLIESLYNYWNDNITDGAGSIHKAKLSKELKEFNKTYCTISKREENKIEQFKSRVLLYMTHIDQYYKPLQLNDFSNLFNRSEGTVSVRESADDE